ncbi:DUF397 domain-containing protein [Streptomyces sp. NBC_01334]|nr:DUF397 domain-containing protein [Streptomyces sp. NBC_01334]
MNPTDWQKSTYSDGGDGNDCVELGSTPATLHLRESEAPRDRPRHHTGPARSVSARHTHRNSRNCGLRHSTPGRRLLK